MEYQITSKRIPSGMRRYLIDLLYRRMKMQMRLVTLKRVKFETIIVILGFIAGVGITSAIMLALQ